LQILHIKPHATKRARERGPLQGWTAKGKRQVSGISAEPA